jgi:anti-sigma-K factor RskA
MSDATIHELSGAYSVDALEPDERSLFEDHLRTCGSCSREVAELQATAALLGGANVEAPAPSVKASLMAQIHATPQNSAPRPAASQSDPSTVTALPIKRRTPWLAVAASVLLVALVALGAFAGSLYRSNSKLAAEAAKVKAVLTAPDAAVASGQVAGGGRAVVVLSKSAGESVFVGKDLAQPASGKTYQLWYISAAGSATSAGTFRPGTDGSVIQHLDGTTPSSTVAVGLTLEPSGGSARPTSKPVSLISVSA